MSSQIKPQALKGFRDFLPDEKRVRNFVANKVTEVFELFGFEPLETPTLEYAALLLGKYGKDADKLVYTFKDRGGRELALRYDQTVPTARILAQYQTTLPKYFRRYQIQNVFRADKPQKGRFREFTQCDIDIFGSTSAIADAEIIAATYYAFMNVGFKKIVLLVNDRQTLFKTLGQFATNIIDVFSIIQSIDKTDKIGKEKVYDELIKKGLPANQAKQAIESIRTAKESDNLKEIIKLAQHLSVPKESIQFKPALARGLDYYTGMIFEVILAGYEGGSCAGGGRYDKLIGQLSGIPIPAVGIAFGFDRMVEATQYFNLVSPQSEQNSVLVTIFDKSTRIKSLQIANVLRQSRITTEVFPGEDKLDKQLKYANKKGIPYVIIVGPDEIKNNTVKLKDMKTGEQEEMKINEVIEKLRN